MPNKRSPIYRALGHKYHIDTCRPQIEAEQRGRISIVGLSHGLYPGRSLEPHHLPGLSGVGYVDAVGPQDWRMDEHRNEGIEICFLETGNLDLTVEGMPVRMQANNMTLTRPWQKHGSGKEGWQPSRLHWLILDVGIRRPNQPFRWPDWVILSPEDLRAFSEALRRNEQPLWTADREIARCFLCIGKAAEADVSGSSVSKLAVYINELLISVMGMFAREPVIEHDEFSSNHRTVEIFLNDLLQNPELLEHHWTLDEMAAECGLSRTAFVRHVRQVSNESPIEFLNRCRLQAAANTLVSYPRKSITELALEHGFGSSQYFANLFRKYHKCTPTEWRRRMVRDFAAHAKKGKTEARSQSEA